MKHINYKSQIANNKFQINVFGKWKLKPRNVSSGFTLIELLVVIAIIGILTSVLMVNFIGIRQRARDAQRKTHIKQLQSAFEVYRSDTGAYPCLGGCTVNDASTINNFTVTLANYLSDEVQDPLNTTACPNYLVASTGSTYTILAVLENSNDADATIDKKTPVGISGICLDSGVAGKCKRFSTTTGCTATYNFWVHNP